MSAKYKKEKNKYYKVTSTKTLVNFSYGQDYADCRFRKTN